MPTENRSSSNHGTRTFTLDSLTAALEQVQALHEISADLIAENVFGQPAQQGQGEPVGEVVAFGKGLHEIAWAAGRMPKLGAKLYTRADPAEVERLRKENSDMFESLKELNGIERKRDAAVVQLAEAHALLRTQDELLSQAYQHDIGTPLKREIREVRAVLSASAEPSARATFVDLIEDAEAEARRMVEQEGRTPRQAFPTDLILRNAVLTLEALSHAVVKPVSAEPSAPVEIDERAEFEKALTGKTSFERNPHHPDFYLHLPARLMFDSWQARAALERKP
ncbi:hypothetical protein [Pseudomonas entomophila]|uniref:hypothetical protein n=1 Tax=Pseudomonas entomophila TaxID=312306 RepID=UPI003EBB40B5